MVALDHPLQMLHRCAVLGYIVAVYACASETDLIYSAFV